GWELRLVMYPCLHSFAHPVRCLRLLSCPFLFPLRDGKAALTSLLPQSGALIRDNHCFRAHDLHGSGNTWKDFS
ncbi:hypothetical protein Tco_1233518, partial [Tanacetum coccineum]